MKHRIAAALIAAGFAGAVPTLSMAQSNAADRAFTLAAPAEVVDSGLLRHLAPRFRFKTRIRFTMAPEGESADLSLTSSGGQAYMVGASGTTYGFDLAAPDDPDAQRFIDWLQSDAGGRAVFAYGPDGAPLFTRPVVAAPIETAAPAPVGDVERGGRLALIHCGRCHVIDQRNRFGGIGSTPSFGALRTIPGWEGKFAAFWVYNPHPAFTQIDGVTEPFDPLRPSPIAPVVLTLEDAEAITDFARSLTPKDLGARVVPR